MCRGVEADVSSGNLTLPDVSKPPPEVLEEILNVWLKDANAVPTGDLEAGVRWAKRLQEDALLRDRLCRVIRKRGRDEISTDEEQCDTTVKQRPVSVENRNSSSHNIDHYMRGIEKKVLQSMTLKSAEKMKTVQPPSGSSPNGESKRGLHSTLAGFPSPLPATAVTNRSAADDAARTQFCGPDKLHRFESQLLSLAASQFKSVSDARSYSSKVYVVQSICDLSLIRLWTTIFELFPHSPRLVDILSKSEILSHFSESGRF